MSTAATTATDNRCPKHLDERLRYVLKGGAGYCAQCRQYVQAAGVPMPAAPERVEAQPRRKTGPKRNRKAKAK